MAWRDGANLKAHIVTRISARNTDTWAFFSIAVFSHFLSEDFSQTNGNLRRFVQKFVSSIVLMQSVRRIASTVLMQSVLMNSECCAHAVSTDEMLSRPSAPCTRTNEVTSSSLDLSLTTVGNDIPHQRFLTQATKAIGGALRRLRSEQSRFLPVLLLISFPWASCFKFPFIGDNGVVSCGSLRVVCNPLIVSGCGGGVICRIGLLNRRRTASSLLELLLLEVLPGLVFFLSPIILSNLALARSSSFAARAGESATLGENSSAVAVRVSLCSGLTLH